MDYDVKDIKTADAGRDKVEWAERRMPVLRMIRERFKKERPLKGARISCCLHVTTETANLAATLKAGGAEVLVCASNPLSTQDDVAASMVKHTGVSVFAVKGEDENRYYAHIVKALAFEPNLTMDDGADLVGALHMIALERYDGLHPKVERLGNAPCAGPQKEAHGRGDRQHRGDDHGRHPAEEHGAGRGAQVPHYRRERRLDQAHVRQPLRHRAEHDGRHAPGHQHARAGCRFVVAGYGWCGKGVAMRAKGLGAHVIVTEVDPLRALEAVMDGFEVMEMAQAAKTGDIFITVTGDVHVLRKEHFERMKDGAIFCNSGHFNVEVDMRRLRR